MLSRLQAKCHPQTVAVCETRADGLGLKAEVMDESKFDFGKDVCGVLVQYPATDGSISDYKVGVYAGVRGRLASRWECG
jgi:glycine dehydrogenase